MAIRENFKDLRKDDAFWNPESGDKTASGGHAMVVVGYDDEKEAFEIMNSWSTQWGNDGFFWVKYKDFGKQCIYGYQLLIGKKMIDNDLGDDWNNSDNNDPFRDANNKKSILNLSAEFVFRYPVDYDDENGWTPLPDGNGNTLELIDASLDNSIPESWQASYEFGTPGELNSNGVKLLEDEIPESELILSHYPNPFNPVTTIKFELDIAQNVKINIYNIKGELVSELVNKTLPSGIQQVEFNGDNLASGIYFYKMEIAGNNKVNKMLLLK